MLMPISWKVDLAFEEPYQLGVCSWATQLFAWNCCAVIQSFYTKRLKGGLSTTLMTLLLVFAFLFCFRWT